jgi:hypothetical protein
MQNAGAKKIAHPGVNPGAPLDRAVTLLDGVVRERCLTDLDGCFALGFYGFDRGQIAREPTGVSSLANQNSC